MQNDVAVEEPLAADGGTPVRQDGFPAWPVFDEEVVEAVASVLRSGKVNYWTGREVRHFEEEFADVAGCRHAVAVANGTVALELALAALDVGPGDDVVVSCRSFVASASCCAMRGATPVFADVDPISQNVTADTVRRALTPKTKAIIAVHLAGWPCEMDPLMHLAHERDLAVIEDCAQAHAATYRRRPVGSLGHVAAFSFCQDKILTTGGEGGMLTTNDERIWEKAWSFKDHGKSWRAVHSPDHSTVFKWLHESIGTNWRMTEMQAAIGRVLLGRLSDGLQTRRRHAAMLDQELSKLHALRLTVPPAHVQHSYYKYYAFLRPERLGPGWSRDRVVRAIQAEGIPCGSGICPEIYIEGAFADHRQSSPEERLRVAGELGETSLMLLVHPTLSERDLLDTCRGIQKVLEAATVSAHVPAGQAA